MSSDPFGDKVRSAADTAEADERAAAAAHLAGAETPLEREVRAWIMKGWSVESQSATQAVVTKGKRPSHLLHLVLTVITLGIWLIVWFLLSVFMHRGRRLLALQPDGTVQVSRV